MSASFHDKLQGPRGEHVRDGHQACTAEQANKGDADNEEENNESSDDENDTIESDWFRGKICGIQEEAAPLDSETFDDTRERFLRFRFHDCSPRVASIAWRIGPKAQAEAAGTGQTGGDRKTLGSKQRQVLGALRGRREMESASTNITSLRRAKSSGLWQRSSGTMTHSVQLRGGSPRERRWKM